MENTPGPWDQYRTQDSDSAPPGEGPWTAYGGAQKAAAPAAPKRTLAAAANDTVIEFANAAAGGASAAANFVKPGNVASRWIDKNIVQAGEDKQSDAVKAEKARLSSDLAGAGGMGDEAAAVGRYIVNNPLLSAAQAAGSFVGPGFAVKGAGLAARAAGAGAQTATRAGRAGGVAAGVALAGGDAAGTAYDLASKAGATEDQAVSAGRQASVIPAIVGGVTGAFGAEKLLAGAKGFTGGTAARALKTGASEALQEGVEEGVTQYEGQRAAVPYDPSIDPMKGVAGAATMGAALGGITGAGVGALDGVQHGAQQRSDAQAAQAAEDPAQAPAGAAPVDAAPPAMEPATAQPDTPPGAQDQSEPVVQDAAAPTNDPLTQKQRITAAEEKLSFVQQQAQANGWDKRLIGARDAAQAELDALRPASEASAATPAVDPRPLSEQMGIDPAAGPLSKGAALAVDSGVTDQMQQAAQAAQAAKEFSKKAPAAQDSQAQAAIQNVATAQAELPPPTNLREGLERIRARRQEAANAQTATTPVAAATAPLPAARASAVEAAGPAPVSPTTGVTNGPEAAQAQQGIAQPAQTGGAATAGPAATPAAGQSATAGGSGVQAAGVEGAITTAPQVVEVKDNYGRTHRVRQSDLYSNADRIPTLRKNGDVVAGEEIPRSIIKDAPSVAETPPANESANPAKSASTPAPADRHPNWRKSMLRAGPVAKAMGIETRGKRLAQVVAEIDAADAQRAGVLPAPQPNTAGAPDAVPPRNLRLADERAPGAADPAQDGAGGPGAGAAPAVGTGQRAGSGTAKPGAAVRTAVPDAGGAGQPAGGVVGEGADRPAKTATGDDGRVRFTVSIPVFGDVPYRASAPVDAGDGQVVSSRVITTKTKLTAANAQALGLPKDKGTVYAWRVSVIRRANGETHSVIEAMATDNGRSPDGEVLAHFKEVENPEAMERIAPAIANAALADWRAAQPQQAPTATETVAKEGALDSGLKAIPAAKVDTPAQGVLNNAQDRKEKAFQRLKTVRQQVKDGTANRLQLIKAESAHKDAVREVNSARAQIEADANKQGLTTVRATEQKAKSAQTPATPEPVANKESAPTAPVPQGREVSREIGKYKEGMSEHRANQVRAELSSKNPGVVYTVEEDAALKNGYVVVGRETAPGKKQGAEKMQAAKGRTPVQFSRAEGRSAPPADSNARNVATQMLVDGLKAKWTRAPEIIVARNMQDPQIPQRVRDYDAQLKSQGSDGEARGFIYKGKVYLLSDQLKGPQQIAEVLFHEVLGHYGLRGAFGDALTPILNQVGLGRRKEVLAKAREYGMVKKGMSDADTWAAMSLQDRLSAAEEVLAEMAQSQPTIGFVQRAIAAIRNWLRANVPGFDKLALTDADIVQAYLLPARGFVTRSKETGAQSLERAMLAFSRDTNGHMPVKEAPGQQDDAQQGALTGNAVIDSGIRFVSEIEALAEEHGRVYIRWSPSAKGDLTGSQQSRDFVSGSHHDGLSAIEITGDMHPVDIAYRLAEYGFLRMQDRRSTPRVYLAKAIGEDSDGYSSIKPSRLLLDSNRDVVKAIDGKLADVMNAMDDIQRELARLKRSPGHAATLKRLESAKDRLKKLLPNEPTAPDGGGAMFSRSPGDAQTMTEEQARQNGFTLKAYRGISKSKPFNDSGTTWLTTSREVAEAYAEEVMGYDDPGVLEVMVKPDGLPRHDASRLTDEQREAFGADQFGNPQSMGIYDRSDDHPLGGSRGNVTVIHAPREAVVVLGSNAPLGDQTQTEAFKRWFGDSKVVDADGKPLVVYHGTSGNEGGDAFTYFDAYASNYGLMGQGAYFTDNPDVASSYTTKGKGDTPTVYKAFLSIQNPIDMGAKADSAKWQEQFDGIEEYHEGGGTNESWYRAAEDLLRDQALPMWEGAEAMQDGLRAMGHDGITHIGGGRVKPDGVRHRVYIAFEPSQVKSATGNNGNFDPDNADIRFSRSVAADGAAQRAGDAIKAVSATNLKQRADWKATDYLGLGLQTLGRRQLVDIYGDALPLEQYNKLAAQMEADKNEVGANADKLATAWGKLKDERQLAELMHDATLAQMDPAKDHVPGDDQMRYKMLRARFNALTPGAKQVYLDARSAYQAHHANVRQAIKDRIERSELKGERKAALLKQMDDEFYKAVKGVYFPLARFGQYVVVVKDADGKVASVNRAETMAEAQALRGSLLKAFPAGSGHTVARPILGKEFVASRDAVGRGFMTELYAVLDKQDMDAAARAELEDTLGQLYLSSLPDLSWAKHGIHRKGTPGFSQDARRAYAQNMFHGARYLAKLRYSDLMQDELNAMQQHVDDWKEVEDFDQPKAQRVVDEMNKRHESLMNPKSNPLSTALTSFGFIFHLGLSPASAMVNLSQTALVAYPIMGAKWGFGKASAALLKASGEAARGKNDITGALTAQERQAYDEAVRTGVIDVTMAHDLAGIAQGEDAGVMWKLRPVMKWASFMFHHAERFNRQVTFVAAYRLAREAGASHQSAYEQAADATYKGHFDYSASNRPRIMQGNTARVLLLFKQYGQNMVYTLARSAQQSLKGATPEARAEARKTLGGLLTMHAAAAGVLGLPMVSTLLAAASMLGGDDDEPWDAEVALQNLLADTFGQKSAEVLAHGLSRLTPWDVSGRVGLDRLIFPDVQEGLEGQRLAESAMTAALGPVAGIGVNVLKGVQEMSQGRYLRGLEAMAPSVARGPLKALRYESEGVKDKSGIVVQDEVDAAALWGQAAGFSPSDVRRSYEGKSAIVQHDRALQARRSALVEQFAMAAMAGDESGKTKARDDIAKFNEKNPARRILPLNLMQSVAQRQKRIREAKEGVYLPAKRRDAMEQGRFAAG